MKKHRFTVLAEGREVGRFDLFRDPEKYPVVTQVKTDSVQDGETIEFVVQKDLLGCSDT